MDDLEKQNLEEEKKEIEEAIKQEYDDYQEIVRNQKAMMEAITTLAKTISKIESDLSYLLKMQRAGKF